MARMGMDVDAVERVGRDLQAQAGQLGDLVGGIDRLVIGLRSAWDGPDARRFVEEWWPQHKTALAALRDAVHGLGQSALNNASEQRGVSGGAPGAGGMGPIGDVARIPEEGMPSMTGPVQGGGAGPEPTSDGSGHPSSAGGAERYTEALRTHPVLAGQPQNWYQCATWASFRRLELGLSNHGGNGYEMAGRIGLVEPTEAGTGSLVSTGSSSSNNHVMVVEERVSGSPLTYRVSEMNTGLDGSDGLHASAAEYRDNTLIRQESDGSWVRSQDGRPFRPMPSPRFSSN